MKQLFVAIAVCIVAGDGAKSVIERREAAFCNLVPFRENRRYAFLDAPATLLRERDVGATVELACGNATTISAYAWFRLDVDAAVNGSVVELNDSRRTIRIGAVDFQTTLYYECRYDETSESVRRDFFYFVQSHPSDVRVDCRTNSFLGPQHWFNNRNQGGDDAWTDYSYFSREINACRASGGVDRRRTPCVDDVVERARNVYALPLVIPVRRNENASNFVCSYSSTWPRRVVDLSCWSVKVSVLEHVEMDLITSPPNGTAAAAPNGTAAATPNGTAAATTCTYAVKSTPVSTLASEAGLPVSVIGVAVGLFCLCAVVILFAVRLKRRAKWEQKGKSVLGVVTIENTKVGSESAI